mgnify:CR=1 FL=1
MPINANKFIDAKSISEFLSLWLTQDCLPETEQHVLRKYYSSYVADFPTRIRNYYDRQTEEVVELVEKSNGGRLLEVGCGCGTESLWLALKGARVVGIDLNNDRLNVARERAGVLRAAGCELNVEFFNQSVLEQKDECQYDIIWMEQAFHHLEPRADVVRKLASLLSPGGHMIISEANGLNLMLQLQLLNTRGFRTVKTYVDQSGVEHQYGNERVLGAGSLKRILAGEGVDSLAIQHFRLFPNHPLFSRLQWIEDVFPRWMTAFFTHYNYVGRKA